MTRSTWALCIALFLISVLQQALAASCDAYFPFEGNLADLSGNGYHGLPIAQEGAPGTPQFAEGKVGQALRVTGGTAMRAFIDLHYDFCPQVTFTAWFKLASLDADGNQYIFSTGGGHGPAIRAQKSTVLMAATGNGISQRDAIRDRNTWFFVAGVYDYTAGTYKLHWRNRVVEGKINESRRPPEDSFWVGTYNDSMSYTAQDLYVDEMRIHGRALTPEEIRAVAADTSGAASASGSGSNLTSLSAEQLTALAQYSSGSSLAMTLTPTLPSCNSHEDCQVGNYCARNNTCHPEEHAPDGDPTSLVAFRPLKPAEFIEDADASRSLTLEASITEMRQPGRISPEVETELIQRVRDVLSAN